MDEPESIGSLTLASREILDNLIFVVNCSLQGPDGPVRRNGKIIGECFGAGWNVNSARMDGQHSRWTDSIVGRPRFMDGAMIPETSAVTA